MSACFLIWVAGTERSTESGYRFGIVNKGLGLHRPYFSPEIYRTSASEIANAQQTMTSIIREYLRRENVSEDVIDLMLSKSSKEIYWVSGELEYKLEGYSHWFEEMMIARCNYDPAYAKNGWKVISKQNQNNTVQPTQMRDEVFNEWRKMYAKCKFQVMLNAQNSMRK